MTEQINGHVWKEELVSDYICKKFGVKKGTKKQIHDDKNCDCWITRTNKRMLK